MKPHAPRKALDEGQGFASLLTQVARDASTARDPVAALRILLTYGGRIPLAVGEEALTAQGRSVHAAITGGAKVTLAGVERLHPVSVAGLRPDGRVLLTGPEPLGITPKPDNEFGCILPLVWLSWSEEAVGRYKRALVASTAALDGGHAVARRWLSEASANEIRDTLSLLHSVGAHAAPLQLYVDEHVFSNFRENNITGKVLLPTSPLGLFKRLADTPPDRWSPEEATLVFCARLVLKADGPAGLEEFNSNQLMPEFVSRRFAEKYEMYRSADAISEELACFAPSEQAAAYANDECAKALADGRVAIARQRQGYREIFGVNLHKRVRWIKPAPAERALVLDALAETWAVKWSVSLHGFDSYRRFLAEWVPAVVAGHIRTTEPWFANAYEELIHDIVCATTEICSADIGMSRGLRSLRALVDALGREDWQEIVSWELPHYYCCAAPSNDLARSFAHAPADLADILWAIAARMQYNAWHFVPGNLPLTRHVTERDYFYPPTLPDLAQWSDQHHRGHVASGVRHAVRAPAAVDICGHKFNGFVDVRLMRRAGVPFGLAELTTAIGAAQMVAEAAGSLAGHLARSGASLRIGAFGPEWYAAQAAACWQSAVAVSTEAT